MKYLEQDDSYIVSTDECDAYHKYHLLTLTLVINITKKKCFCGLIGMLTLTFSPMIIIDR